mmetsp:Transcript_9890/g.22487  ORF Transcript_9890/g.22487 Transcript_9890/m.22487 type:complete len:238 (-) Transcript_9890:256-969(-)
MDLETSCGSDSILATFSGATFPASDAWFAPLSALPRISSSSSSLPHWLSGASSPRFEGEVVGVPKHDGCLAEFGVAFPASCRFPSSVKFNSGTARRPAPFSCSGCGVAVEPPVDGSVFDDVPPADPLLPSMFCADHRLDVADAPRCGLAGCPVCSTGRSVSSPSTCTARPLSFATPRACTHCSASEMLEACRSNTRDLVTTLKLLLSVAPFLPVLPFGSISSMLMMSWNATFSEMPF